jgi:deoxycytidylate deaminase
MKYPYLPEGYTIEYVGGDNPFMQQAKEVARTSNERHMPTGAVAVYNNEIISQACNHAPISSDTLIHLHKKYCFRRILKIKSGKSYWLCPGCASPHSHAEARTVAGLSEKGIRDFDLYLWGHYWACKDCWDAMIKAGVKQVFLLEGSEVFFNKENPNNSIGKQFEI